MLALELCSDATGDGTSLADKVQENTVLQRHHAPVPGPEVSGLNTLIIFGHTGFLLLIHINHIRKIFVIAPKPARD